jgi:hypothetical protein
MLMDVTAQIGLNLISLQHSHSGTVFITNANISKYVLGVHLLACCPDHCQFGISFAEEIVLYPAIAKHQSKEDADRLLAETHAVQQVLAELNAASNPADPHVAELVQKTIQVGPCGVMA